MVRRYGVAVCFLVLIAAAALADATQEATQEATHESVGVGRGLLIAGDRENPCPGSELRVNADGSYENGYAWRYDGVVPPYYGAFAEGYTATGTVCGISYKLTTLLSWYATMDCYVWDSDGWNPLNVLAVVYDFYPGAPAIWPNVSAHDLGIPDTDIDGEFFVGYWGNWPGSGSPWYVAADLDGPGGMPRTNVAPGIGYPTGWEHPGIVWEEPIQAFGIDAYVLPAPPTPVEPTTWGRIKMLAR